MPKTHTITITIDDETHRRACAAAEQRGISLPELACQALTGSIADVEVKPAQPEVSPEKEAQYRKFIETADRISAAHPNFHAGDRLSREEIYMERDFFRRRGLD